MNTGFGVIQVSLRFVIETSEHSVSNHLPSSRRVPGFFCVRLTGPRCRGHLFPDQCVTWASPVPSRLATTVGRIEFTCVTDCSFTSGCSPPRLTATQLPLVTEYQNTPARTFTLLIRCNYRRTRVGATHHLITTCIRWVAPTLHQMGRCSCGWCCSSFTRTRRARNKNKSEMIPSLPFRLSIPTSHQPTAPLSKRTSVKMFLIGCQSVPLSLPQAYLQKTL